MVVIFTIYDNRGIKSYFDLIGFLDLRRIYVKVASLLYRSQYIYKKNSISDK